MRHPNDSYKLYVPKHHTLSSHQPQDEIMTMTNTWLFTFTFTVDVVWSGRCQSHTQIGNNFATNFRCLNQDPVQFMMWLLFQPLQLHRNDTRTSQSRLESIEFLSRTRYYWIKSIRIVRCSSLRVSCDGACRQKWNIQNFSEFSIFASPRFHSIYLYIDQMGFACDIFDA